MLEGWFTTSYEKHINVLDWFPRKKIRYHTLCTRHTAHNPSCLDAGEKVTYRKVGLPRFSAMEDHKQNLPCRFCNQEVETVIIWFSTATRRQEVKGALWGDIDSGTWAKDFRRVKEGEASSSLGSHYQRHAWGWGDQKHSVVEYEWDSPRCKFFIFY